MKRLRDVLTRIKWDENESPEDYEIHYWDNVAEKNIIVKGTDLDKVETNFFILKTRTEIPIHRIRKITRKGEAIWEK